MAKTNSTRITRAPKGAIPAPNDEARRRSGAHECVSALRALEHAAAIPPDDTLEAYFAQQAADAKAFAAHFGPMPPEVEGVITGLAEYIHTQFTTGQPNLDKWLPVSAKTGDELRQEIESMEADPAQQPEGAADATALPTNPMCHRVPMDKFDNATLKLDGARALVSMFGIFAGEVENGEPLPVSGEIINSAMNGIDLLIESAIDDLLATEGGAE